jgi:SAM-dependent methyltransferase
MAKYDYFKEKKLSPFGQFTHNRVQRRILKIMQRFVPANGTILEIGPGVGGLAQVLSSNNYRYSCIDRNSSLVEFLKSKGVDAHFAEAPPIPFDNSSLDCVILVNVLEHMSGPDAAVSLLSDARRVLRTGGKLFLLIPHTSGWGNDIYDVDYTHTFPVCPERMRQMFADTEFNLSFIGLTYGGLSGFIGFFADLVNNALCGIIYKLFPLNSKIVKAKILFHPSIWLVGEKKDE